MNQHCRLHSQDASAFCRTHQVLVCVKCFIENIHDTKESRCEIVTLLDFSKEKNYVLEEIVITTQNVKSSIKLMKRAENDLDELQTKMIAKIESCYIKRKGELESQKEITTTHLNEEIKSRRDKISRRLVEFQNHEKNLAESEDEIKRKGCLQAKNSLADMLKEIQLIKDISDQELKMNTNKIDATFQESNDYTLNERFGVFQFNDEQNESISAQTHEEVIYERKLTSPLSSDEVVESRTKNHSINRRPETNVGRRSCEFAQLKPSKVSNVRPIDPCLNSPCSFKKLETLPDERIVLLDIAHNRVLVVGEHGLGITMYSGDGTCTYGFVVDMCLTKKNHLALFRLCDSEQKIFQVKVCKDKLEQKSVFGLGESVPTRFASITGFEADQREGIFYISYPNRVLKVGRGNNPVFFVSGRANFSNHYNAITHFDCSSNCLYSLEKDKVGQIETSSLKCYDISKQVVGWTEDKILHLFTPSAMRIRDPKSLVVICAGSGRLLEFDKKDGHVLNQISLELGDNIEAFGIKGKNLIVLRSRWDSSMQINTIQLSEFSRVFH